MGWGGEDENEKGLQGQAEEEFRGIGDQFREWVLFGRGLWRCVWVAPERWRPAYECAVFAQGPPGR